MTRAKLRWITAELRKLDIDQEVGRELAALMRREPEFLHKERSLIEHILQKGKTDGTLAGVGAVRPTARVVQSLLRCAVLEAARGDASGAEATGRLPRELFDVLLVGLASARKTGLADMSGTSLQREWLKTRSSDPPLQDVATVVGGVLDG